MLRFEIDLASMPSHAESTRLVEVEVAIDHLRLLSTTQKGKKI